jgi:hypothetical protein
VIYSVVTSWLYPTESGRDVCSWDFESREEARAAAKQMCKEEKENFEKVTGRDASDPETTPEFNDFFIIMPKTGHDKWFFSAEAVELVGYKLRSTKKEEAENG